MMKKIFASVLVLAVISASTIAGCGFFGSGTKLNNFSSLGNISSDDILAYSAYIMGSFAQIEGSTTYSSETLVMGGNDGIQSETLDTEDYSFDDFLVSENFNEVSKYFQYLKVFLDNDLSEVFDLGTGDNEEEAFEDYEKSLSFNVDNEVYIIYYNQIGEDIDGILIFEGVQYLLTGSNEIDDNEQEIEFRAVDMLNPSNWIEVSLEIENEDDEYSFEMTVEKEINDIYSEYELEISNEIGETEITLEIVSGTDVREFSFEKEIDGLEIDYEFEYYVNGVEGSVEVTVTEDINGNKIFTYKIEEEGKHHEIVD